jgi:hypothetical protein
MFVFITSETAFGKVEIYLTGRGMYEFAGSVEAVSNCF